MKKNVLAMSIAAMIGGLSLAGGASAAVFPAAAVGAVNPATVLEINNDGKGQILLVPYYNASETNTTVINLVNSDLINGKALKVRFRGANNSDDVFDFTLFLSPGDVWSGAVVHNNGSAALKTNDNSCVLPADAGINSDTPINFVTSRLGSAGAKGTLEGYVEVLNMADIPPNAIAGSLYTAIKHVNGVAPCFTAAAYAPVLATLATEPDLATATGTAAGQLGLSYPTTGLFANWTLINVTNVASWGGNATAVEAREVAGVSGGTGNIVFFPQINAPTNGVIGELTADPLLLTGRVTPRQYDLPDLSTPYLAANAVVGAGAQADDLTASLAVTAVQNEFITSASVGGATDWVFSMPTRRYHVALDYASTVAATPPATGTEYRVFRDGTAVLPGAGTTYFRLDNTSVDSGVERINRAGERSICVSLGSNALDYRDRSERTPAPGGFVISPNQPAAGLSFCGEASVLSFNSALSNVLGSTIGQNGVTLTSGFNSGWASISTPNPNGGVNVGYPILGAAFQKFLNVGVGNTVQGNFGSVWPHRYNRPLP